MSSRKLTDEEYAEVLAERNKRVKGGRQLSTEDARELESSHSQQSGDEGEIAGSFEEQALGLFQTQADIIQGLADTQGNQVTINNQMLEIVKGLEARIEMLEQVNGLHKADS